MVFRAKSRVQQWLRWCGLVIAATIVGAIWSRLATGTVDFAYLNPVQNLLVLPFAAGLLYLAWELRWDGMTRNDGDKFKEEVVESPQTPIESAPPSNVDQVVAQVDDNQADNQVIDKKADEAVKQPIKATISPIPDPPADSVASAGEELYIRARQIAHQIIPDFEDDIEYLQLLGESVKQGYAPAMTKLGEYALRRGTLVEAYYWMNLAKRNEMLGLEEVLGEICTAWLAAGCPQEVSNVNILFDGSQGSIGRAWLDIDCNCSAESAREFLREHFPEFA